MLISIVLGIFVSFVLGYFSLIMKGAMNACGVAINLAATGGTVFVLAMVCGSKNNSSSVVSKFFPNIQIPVLKDIPFLGDILSGQNLVTYIGWLAVIVMSILLYRTRIGVEIRAVGGMYLSMSALHGFTAGMVSGRGYLSLAMDAIARGNPLIGGASSLLYGFANTITVYLQLNSKADLQLISAFPYLCIVLVLVIIQMARSRAEKHRRKSSLVGNGGDFK